MSRARGTVAIVGIADTPVGVVPRPGATGLCIDAILGALADAGLPKDAVDGLVTLNPTAEPYTYHAEAIAESLGLAPSWCWSTLTGGSSAIGALQQAVHAIDAGACEVVVIAMADSLRSGLTREAAVAMQASTGHPQFERPYGAPVVAHYALIARAHMHEDGTTPEQFAAVAVATRAHAARNPAAQMRTPIAVDDVLASRPIADPLKLLDCSLVSDGGAALVLTSAVRARDLRRPPVYFLGAGAAVGHEHVSQARSLTTSAAVESGRRAYAAAGAGPREIDFAQLYDCFTPVVLIELEDLGFCAKGEAGAFVAAGHTAPGGRLPVNTHGGLLSHAHSGHPSTLFAITETVRQLRGECGERQLARAELALVHGQGGVLSSHATAIFGRAPR
ncbi:MAG: thiolase C-terminal domain-containing protein [Pseudomonadota bacterium]